MRGGLSEEERVGLSSGEGMVEKVLVGGPLCYSMI